MKYHDLSTKKRMAAFLEFIDKNITGLSENKREELTKLLHATMAKPGRPVGFSPKKRKKPVELPLTKEEVLDAITTAFPSDLA